MEKIKCVLIKLNKMREAYKFTELINIIILNIGIFNYILLKLKFRLIKIANIKTFLLCILDIIHL
jgi:hypothetical protein